MDTTGAQTCSPCLLSNVWDQRNCAVSRLRTRRNQTGSVRHAPYVAVAPRDDYLNYFKYFTLISIFYVFVCIIMTHSWKKILKIFQFLALLSALLLRCPNLSIVT